MNLKNLFKTFAFLACVLFFVACETPVGPEKTESRDVYLYGNCTESGMHGYVMGIDDNRNHTYSAASLLDMLSLTDHGTHILGIRAYIGDEVTNASVWVGEDYENPTYSKDFTYKKGGWQYVLFDEPIALNSNAPDIYIGYTITGKGGSVLAAESSRKSSKTEWISIDGDWSLLSRAAGNALWSIQAIVGGGDYSEEKQHDLIVESVVAPRSANAGAGVNVTCEVRNAGIKETGNVEVKCTFGGSSVSVVISEPLMNGQSAIVEFPVVNAPTAGGFSDLVVSASEDEVTDDKISNNNVTKSLRVYSESVPRNCLLVEQFTGQDCPNCPGGAKVMAAAIEELDDPSKAIWVAHHTYYQDEFSLSESAVIADILGANYAPACNINRIPYDYGKGVAELIWHPGYATKAILETTLAEPGLATIEVNRTYNADTRELVVEVKGRSIEKDAYITAIVTQSGIEARQSGANGMYVHNNAPRKFLTAAKGNKLELDADGNYVVTYTYTIPEKVGTFTCLPENMAVVAFVHGNISDSMGRMVYNAEHVTVVPEVDKAAIRAMSLYNNNSVEFDIFNVELKPWSEQVCR